MTTGRRFPGAISASLRFPSRSALVFILVVLAAGVLLAGCERSDRSFRTSPSVRTLLGTTTLNNAVNPPETPPPPQPPAKDWNMELGLANFTRLDNGSPAIEVILVMDSRRGAGMEVWLTSDETNKPIARWSGGATDIYQGTVCFQLVLQRDGEAIPVTSDGKYHLTAAFRDPSEGVMVAADTQVTGNTPKVEGSLPEPSSSTFGEALACPRSN